MITNWIFAVSILVLFIMGLIGNAMAPGPSGIVMIPIWGVIIAVSIFLAGIQISIWFLYT